MHPNPLTLTAQKSSVLIVFVPDHILDPGDRNSSWALLSRLKRVEVRSKRVIGKQRINLGITDTSLTE